MKVEPAVHQISIGREPFTGFPPPNSFLVCGSQSSVMNDSGWESENDHYARLQLIKSLNVPPVNHVILTHRHPDHAGGALRLYEEFNANLACHHLERSSIESERYVSAGVTFKTISEGDRFELGNLTIEIIDTPGHTIGCIAPYIPELNALFASDSVMGISTTVVRSNEGDLGEYEKSLRKMQSIRPRIIYSGHGPPVTNPMARLEFLIDHRLKREHELINLLSISEMSIDRLCEAMYKGISKPREALAKEQIISILRKLKNEGAVKEDHGAIWQIN